MAGRPINESLALARLTGDRTYEGQHHTPCNTSERYVSGGGCVHCARLIASEQRAARKALKARAAEDESTAIRTNELTPEFSAATDEITYPNPWD